MATPTRLTDHCRCFLEQKGPILVGSLIGFWGVAFISLGGTSEGFSLNIGII
jgi:hypothetical protein